MTADEPICTCTRESIEAPLAWDAYCPVHSRAVEPDEKKQRVPGRMAVPMHCYDLFGVECGAGWRPLYLPLLTYCAEHGLSVYQVKEKFGGLRFYAGTDEVLKGFVDAAEAASFKTCEDCGQPGELRGGGWYRTLCDACYVTWREP